MLPFIIYNICHWLGDFTHLSTDKMLRAKQYSNPSFPIWCHAFVHGALFWIASLFLNWEVAGKVFAIIAVSHFWIDFIKGKMNVLFPCLINPSNKFHWYVFGLDQLLHQLVIAWIILTIL